MPTRSGVASTMSPSCWLRRGSACMRSVTTVPTVRASSGGPHQRLEVGAVERVGGLAVGADGHHGAQPRGHGGAGDAVSERHHGERHHRQVEEAHRGPRSTRTARGRRPRERNLLHDHEPVALHRDTVGQAQGAALPDADPTMSSGGADDRDPDEVTDEEDGALPQHVVDGHEVGEHLHRDPADRGEQRTADRGICRRRSAAGR